MEWYGIFQESIGKEINMLTLELRPYDPESDELRNGWDALSVKQATAEGKNLYFKKRRSLFLGRRKGGHILSAVYRAGAGRSNI